VMPFAGVLLIEHFQAAMGSAAGLIYAVRLLYLSVALGVAAGEVFRLRGLKEAAPLAKASGFLPRRYISSFTAFPPHLPRYFRHSELFKQYGEETKWLWGQRAPFYYWMATAMSAFAASMPVLAYPLYVVDYLRLQLSALAVFASISTATGVLLTVFLAPHLSTKVLKKYMVFGFSVAPLASIMFISAKGNLGLLAGSGVLGSFSGAFAGPAGGGYWADLIPNERRAKVSAVTGVMTNLLIIPSQFIGILPNEQESSGLQGGGELRNVYIQQSNQIS